MIIKILKAPKNPRGKICICRCDICSREFKRNFGLIKKRQFCSVGCKAIWQSRYMRGWNHTIETKRKMSDSAKKKIWTEEHRRKLIENRPHREGKEAPCWKGGRKKTSDGYILIYDSKHPNREKDNYVLEHRLVMEKHLGRYLKPEEVVHHNGERDNNVIENLILFANDSEHQKYHHGLRRYK